MFNKDSGLVAVWVSLILKGVYKKEQVPKMDNLREIVYQVLEEVAK